MKIYFVRHGETDWNVEKKIQGSVDIPLNLNGIQQARELANEIKDLKIDIIICSPLKRAHQTAEIINEKFNLEIIIDNRLAERNYGINKGKSTHDFEYKDFWNYEKHVKWQDAEEIGEFFMRVHSFLNELKEKTFKNVLIVSHSGVSKAINYYFNEMNHEEIVNFKIKNGKIVEYELSR